MCIPSKNPGYGPDTIQVQLADGRDYFLENWLRDKIWVGPGDEATQTLLYKDY